MDNLYLGKYLKYKKKYLNLNIQLGCNNKQEALDPFKFKILDTSLRNNSYVVLAAVMKYRTYELMHDKEVVLAAIKQTPLAFKYAFYLSDNKDIVLEAAKLNGAILAYVKSFQNYKDVVLAAVINYDDALKSASKKNILTKIKANLKEKEYKLISISDEFMLEAFKINESILYYGSKELKSNKDFILVVVKIKGLALEFADQKLISDKNVVLEAVKQNCIALQYSYFKQNKEVVFRSCKINWYHIIICRK